MIRIINKSRQVAQNPNDPLAGPSIPVSGISKSNTASNVEQKTEKNAQLSKENQAFQTATEQREKELAALRDELKAVKSKWYYFGS